DVPSRREIDARLNELVELAKRNGAAIGFAQSYPVTIQRLKNWAFRLRRQGVVLAPVSALANRQVTAQSADEAEAARRQAEQLENEAAAAQENGDESAEPTNTIEN
ncbi:divergent polysaccharide deacetylase family protein, partial [Kocuria rosea]